MSEDVYVLRRKGEVSGYNFLEGFESSGDETYPNFLRLKYAHEFSFEDARLLQNKCSGLLDCDIVHLSVAHFENCATPDSTPVVKVKDVPIGKLFTDVDHLIYLKLSANWVVAYAESCPDYIHDTRPDIRPVDDFNCDVRIIGELQFYDVL